MHEHDSLVREKSFIFSSWQDLKLDSLSSFSSFLCPLLIRGQIGLNWYSRIARHESIIIFIQWMLWSVYYTRSIFGELELILVNSHSFVHPCMWHSDRACILVYLPLHVVQRRRLIPTKGPWGRRVWKETPMAVMKYSESKDDFRNCFGLNGYNESCMCSVKKSLVRNNGITQFLIDMKKNKNRSQFLPKTRNCHKQKVSDLLK